MKTPDPTDVRIGARVRMHRRNRSMTQEELGSGLGLTFQQVQKYEKGINRIGVGRLQQIANILHVPVGSLFDEGAEDIALRTDFSDSEISDFVSSDDGLALARSFRRIDNSRLRRRVVKLVEELSMTEQQPAAE